MELLKRFEMNTPTICTTYDSYLQDQDTTVWVAELSDGTLVYGDDGRYGEKDVAWTRLREYLKDYVPCLVSDEYFIPTENFSHKDLLDSKVLKITKLFIKFRSHTELVAERTENTVGFYFGRGAAAWVGQPTMNYMVVGTVQKSEKGKLAHTTKWRVPEIIEDEKDTRNPEDYEENIIWDC